MINRGSSHAPKILHNSLSRLFNIMHYLSDNNQSNSYYPEKDRKNNWRVFIDKLTWGLKYKEINHYYYSYGFDVLGKNDSDEYMPYSIFMKMRNEINKRSYIGGYDSDYLSMLKDKFVFSMFLSSLNIPTPKVLALGVGGHIESLCDRKRFTLEEYLFPRAGEFFIKTVGGENADGVFHLRMENGETFLNNIKTSIGGLLSRLPRYYIIQEKIRQHHEINEFYPHSVNTVRLVTVNNKNGVSPFGAFMRIGAKGNYVDNWAVGGVLIGINYETGTLKKFGFFKPGFGGKVDRHPDSGMVFDGYAIPFYSEAVNLASRAHGYFYGIRSIGWDIALTDDGPLIIEGNDNWEISPLQISDGGLKNRFMEYMQ
jgi:hypothetical protein